MIFKKKDEKLKKELLLQLRKLHYTLTGNSDIVLTEKSKLNHTIDLTSLGKIQFICLIEEEFNLEIPNYYIHSLRNFNDLINHIMKYKFKKGN